MFCWKELWEASLRPQVLVAGQPQLFLSSRSLPTIILLLVSLKMMSRSSSSSGSYDFVLLLFAIVTSIIMCSRF